MSDAINRLTAALADRYRIGRELGAGGMATVYLAHDLRHDRQVAIKVLRHEVVAELEADRFLLEIRTTANLQHPHIVPVFDSGIAHLGHTEHGEVLPDVLYYVMPLIEGESLGLVAALHGDVVEAAHQLGMAFEQLPEDHDVAAWYALQLAYIGRSAVAIAITRAITRSAPDHPLAWGIESISTMLAGRHAAAVARAATAPPSAPAGAVPLIAGLAHAAAGDRESAIETFDRAAALEPDVFTIMCGFLAHSLRGDAAGARRALRPDVVQYTEYIAQGFALLGDAEEAAHWLEQSVRLGFGVYDAVTVHNAVWRPWLTHPLFVPVLESLKRNAERYAQLPVAPRALAMVS
jgi:tetratricopeptide (TPR) repeat protein